MEMRASSMGEQLVTAASSNLLAGVGFYAKRITTALQHTVIAALGVVIGFVVPASLGSIVMAQSSSVTPVIERSTTQYAAYTTPAGLPDTEQIYRVVNDFRASQGLSIVNRDSVLSQIAAERAADMATNNIYQHKTSAGGFFDDIMNQKGYQYSSACENLDLTTSKDPAAILKDWATSTKGHRECMLRKDATQAGYAVAKMPGLGNDQYVIVAIYSQP